MKFVEAAGLIKFDFLGLKTLTVISTAIETIKKTGYKLNILKIPLTDVTSFEMISRGETVGVFSTRKFRDAGCIKKTKA